MARINLVDLANLENESTAIGAVNVNNETLEEIMDKALFRTGESPNHMEASLDMNSNKIINLPAAVAGSSDPVRAQDLASLIPSINTAQIAIDGAIAAQAAAENAAAQAIAAAGSINVGTIAVQNSNAVNISGGAITGTAISGIPDPAVSADIANKKYADLQNPENARVLVRVATTTVLPGSPVYTAATGTTRASLAGTGSLTVDGVLVNDGDRVLVKDQATALHNDVYIKSTASSNYKLTSASDIDDSLKGETFYVNEGTTNAGKYFARVGNTPNYYTDTVFLIQNNDFATNGKLDVTNRNVTTNTAQIGSNTSSINTLNNNFRNLAPSANTDTTNASNITSGTLPDARLSNVISASSAGDSTHIPVIAWDAHGRLTSVSSALSSSNSYNVGIVAPGVNGVIGNNTTDKTTIAAVITTGGRIDIYPGTYLIDDNTTWPANKIYVIHPGVLIIVSSGKTLTVQGEVWAGDYKIFGNTTNTVFDLAGTVSGIKSVRPEWWGTVRDGVTNDYAAMQAAINCAQAITTSSQRTPLEYKFSAGAYATNHMLSFLVSTSYIWNIYGVGSNSNTNYDTKIVALPSFTGTAAVELDGSSSNPNDFDLGNLSIVNQDFTAGPAFGLYIHDFPGGYKPANVHDLLVLDFNRGLQFQNARMVKYTNCTFWNDHQDAPGTPLGIWMTADAGKFVGDSEFFQCQTVCGNSIHITGAANNGAGLIRLSMYSTSTLSTGMVVQISGVSGTTEANGSWTITVVDGTHIDLQGSAFSNTYTSGGSIDSHTSRGRGVSINITGGSGAGIKFLGCNFYYGDVGLDISANGAGVSISDIWLIPGNQFEGHNVTGATTVQVAATASGASINNVQVLGSYMVGEGWNKNFVVSATGGGIVHTCQFKHNFCNNTYREAVDIRGTGGAAYGMQVHSNIFRGVSKRTAGGHNAIYIQDCGHTSVNDNSLVFDGGSYQVDHLCYFNVGGLYQTAVGNNSGGNYSAGNVVDADATRTGMITTTGLNV